MAHINYDYVRNEELYNSGDVEQQLLDMYKSGKKVFFKENPDFFYILTPIRENIICWYDFKKDSTILEVGGGLGSVTGSLCSKAKKVVSNEYSKRRAEVLYNRLKDVDNLEVIVGNFNEIEFKEKFDYIVLIGVYEYAKRFCKTDRPFHDFLMKLKSLLKKDGVILIAIENRYGIKYFAGAPEDHYGKRFLGLNGYEECDIQTFGKAELNKLFEECGFEYSKYYYPYPDYKMPYIIHTDFRLPEETELTDFKLYNHGDNLYSFDYRKTLSGIIENNQYGFFANSFLIELSERKESLSDIAFSKMFWTRDPKYQIYTNILENRSVYKSARNEEAINHIKNIYYINNELNKLNVKVPKMELIHDRLKIEYIEGITLTELLSNYTNQKRLDLIYDELNKYVDFLKSFSIKKEITNYAVEEEQSFFIIKKLIY